MSRIKPLKRFGQNYLKDKNIIRKVINEIAPGENDQIIEIGPGLGALTEELYKKNIKYTAIEIDGRAIDQLKLKFDKIDIVEKDFLKSDLKDFVVENKRLKVVGNIPYNITSPIVFKLINDRSLVDEAVLMVQDEVAKRMTAKYKTKDYSLMSVLLSYFTNIKYCFKISPNVFYPKPKVNSALIHLYFNRIENKEVDGKLFIKLVKASFGYRRKTLKNSLSNSIFKNSDFEKLDFDFSRRAEELTLEDFITLTKFIQTRDYARKN